MTSVTDICNAALLKLGEKRITDAGFATPTNERERVCSEHYERIRDRELRKNRWNFSVKRISISADEDAPVYGFDCAYSVPADMLRFIEIYETRKDYKLEGAKILTDVGDEINIRYVRKVTVVNEMDAIFRDALAAALAVEFCERLPGKSGLKSEVKSDYVDQMTLAAQAGALENPVQELPEDDWITCRI
jgi:hypothetical protein